MLISGLECLVWQTSGTNLGWDGRFGGLNRRPARDQEGQPVTKGAQLAINRSKEWRVGSPLVVGDDVDRHTGTLSHLTLDQPSPFSQRAKLSRDLLTFRDDVAGLIDCGQAPLDVRRPGEGVAVGQPDRAASPPGDGPWVDTYRPGQRDVLDPELLGDSDELGDDGHGWPHCSPGCSWDGRPGLGRGSCASAWASRNHPSGGWTVDEPLPVPPAWDEHVDRITAAGPGSVGGEGRCPCPHVSTGLLGESRGARGHCHHPPYSRCMTTWSSLLWVRVRCCVGVTRAVHGVAPDVEPRFHG